MRRTEIFSTKPKSKLSADSTTVIEKEKPPRTVRRIRINRGRLVDLGGASLSFLSGLFFGFWVIPPQMLDPQNTDWIFNSEPALRDVASSSLATLFFIKDSWQLPLGSITSIGGPIDSNLVGWAASPIISIFQKVLATSGLIPETIQVAAWFLIIGWSITGSTFYFLARKFGANSWLSASFGVSIFGLQALWGQFNNHALAFQFLPLLACLLVLARVGPLIRWLALWPILLVTSLGVNAYFFAMVAPFFAADLIRTNTWKVRGQRFLTLLYAMPSAFGSFGAMWTFGAFEAGGSITTDPMFIRIYSSSPFGLFDGDWINVADASAGGLPQNDSGILYLGAVPTLIFAILLISRKFDRTDFWQKQILPNSRVILPSLFLFILSWGPVWRFFGSFEFTLPFWQEYALALSTFRAVGRLGWPFMYVALALIAAAASLYLSALSKRRFLVKAASISLLPSLIAGIYFEHGDALVSVRRVMSESMTVDSRFYPAMKSVSHRVKAVEVLPAFDGDIDSVPWRPLARMALENNLTLDSYAFMGRYSSEKAAAFQAERFEQFLSCKTDKNGLYVLRNEYIESVMVPCEMDYELIFQTDSWSGALITGE